MTPIEIERKLYHCVHLQQADLDRLIDAGVPHTALWQPDCLAKATVIFHRERCFDFTNDVNDPSGAGDAYIIVARNEFDDITDLVAWQPRTKNIAAWLGRVPILGAESIFWPRLSSNRALRVYPSPLEWLVAGRRGIVVLDAKRALSLLDYVGPLACESNQARNSLRRALTRRPPRILVAPQRPAA